MNPSLATALIDLKTEKERLEKEVATLKKKLQHRHTEIFDLKTSKRDLENYYQAQLTS